MMGGYIAFCETIIKKIIIEIIILNNIFHIRYTPFLPQVATIGGG